MTNTLYPNLRRKGWFGVAIAITVLGVVLAFDPPHADAFLVGALVLLVINLSQVAFAQVMIRTQTAAAAPVEPDRTR